MNTLNWLFTLSSLSVILVTIERFSFTTKILLQPFNFLRLHELVQMSILILLTVIIPFLILKVITDDFKTVQNKKGFLLFLAFIVGIYFYATGNGLHEVSSFNLNNFCDLKKPLGAICKTFFINDYYTGNIIYFIGAFLMVVPLMLLEKIKQTQVFNKKELTILVVNAIVYSFAIFAYAAFDVVLVGLIYSVIVTVIADLLFLQIRKKYLQHPVILYYALIYSLGTIAALLFRFR